MTRRQMLVVLAAVLVVFSPGTIRGQSNPSVPAPAPDNVTGCLGAVSSGFDFTDKDGNLYRVTGATSGLSRYVGEIVEATGTIEKSAKSLPTLTIARVRLVSKIPPPQLKAAFLNTQAWRREENRTYGVSFSHPKDFPAQGDGELSPNFPIQHGTVTLGSFGIAGIYDGTNFRGGSFTLSVNPKINNRESCEQFQRSDPRKMTVSGLDGIRYAVLTEVSAATGTAYVDRYFHTFQNGLCYEFGFDFGEVNTRNYDLWCTIPSLSKEDEWNVIRPLLRGVSFVTPAPPVVRENPAGGARVTSFKATETINNITTQPETTLSWSAENVDYIELSYECPKGPSGMTIQEGQLGRGCGDRLDQSFPVNRSANGSVIVNFANFDHDDPVPVEITLTPFRRAIPYSNLIKQVTVSVNPWNPLPEGARSGTQNMTLSYLQGADGKKKYEQGSLMTVRWTDTERDPCINIFLVQDDEKGVAAYRARFGEKKCQTPARTGSYAWHLPNKYLGSGFRVYAAAPGGVSWVLGDAFEIFRPN